jgi:phosphoglycolate phosphatase
MVKLVIFDLDGTLANTLEDLAVATNYGLEKAGLPTHPIESYNFMVGSGADNLVKRAMSPVESSELFKVVKDGFNEYYNAHSIDKTTAYEDTAQFLDYLSQKGVKTAVLSNKPDEFVAKILEKIFPNHKFSYAWGKKPEYNIKPDPSALNAIIAKAGVEKSECIYVGDSDVDCFTSHNAEVKCCGVSWGFRGRKELETAGADVVVDKAMDIAKKFEI